MCIYVKVGSATSQQTNLYILDAELCYEWTVKVQVYFVFHFSKLTSMLTALNFIHCVYVACFMKRKKKKIFKMWKTYCTVDQCQFV